MSEEDLLVSQHEEVEAIKAMYPGDVEVAESGKPQFIISLYPQRGSSGGGGSLENVTFVKLQVAFPPMYPKVIPKFTIKEYKGLSAQEIQELTSDLKKKCEENLGEVMMYPVLLMAEEFLHAHQKKPTGSFHDEMLMRNKLLQERNLQMQMMFKEKERKAIKEEILRKQEEMKEEQRRRRELWKNQNNDVMTCDNVESSPTKADSFSMGVRPPIMTRRKRRSISSRRRRSNSEGSDSSFSEGSDLVLLEFVSGKSVQQYYKGEVIGRSDRGSTVYAGISKFGSLVAIYEWRFALPVDRKGRSLESSGNDMLTTEGLIKQLQSLETESNFLQKLEHSNTILYYGMKIVPATDEAGVVYLYSVQEFVRGHTLRSYLQDPHELCTMALPLLRHITNGVLEALKFLHDNNIAHRFLRDTSIFLDVGDLIKLGDYGIERKAYDLYKQINPNSVLDDIFPPSVGRGGKKGDIYRLGLIVLSVLKGRYVDGPEIPQTLPEELKDFLKRCLSTLENNRWTATELLDHPFIKMSISKGPNIQLKESPQPPKDDDGSNDDADPVLPPRIASTIPFSLHSRLHNEFQVLEWLGKGGFGDVLKVRNKLDSRIYALKRIKLNPRNKQLNKKITREVKLLSQLNHENVVRYFNSWIETVEEDDVTESTDTMSTEPTSPDKKSLKEPSVRFQLDKVKLNQNSLGMFDNIEDLAPPMKDSEWSISIANNGDDAEDSEDSSDEVDLFGTSFLRLTNDDSEAVIFESDSRSGRNVASETDNDTAEESFRSKRFSVESTNESFNKKDMTSHIAPLSREIQYMYIQMEFCEKSTLRTAIDDNLYEDSDRAWRLFREIVEGLVHIHQQGMIHRDLKPVNIFLDSHDHVKIGDFGLATSSILPKLTAGDLVNEKHEDPQSVDFPDESQTGQVGTALYVAPELITKASKVSYNQKVDIYSLGIILFEMFYRPLPTAMERVRVITALRQTEVIFPKDFDEHLMPQITHMTRWLLNHDPGLRPTSLELLQSDYLPPPHLEEAELRDIFSRTLKNSQSKAYKFLIASCFLQKVTPVEDFTFDMENTRFPPSGNYLKCYHFLHKLKLTVQRIFDKHGGVEIPTPLLMPKTEFYEDSDTSVNLMCHSGTIVSLPHDLRIPFVRYIGRHGITHMKRYSIEKVFRERKVYGLHPRELVECAFDIVDCTPGSLIADAEIISIAFEVIQELPWLKNKACTIRLGHTKLLEGLLIHHGIDTKYHDPIKKTLSEIKVDSTSSKSQIQTYLCSRGLPEHFIQMLFALMEVEGSLPKVSNILKSITKRKSEAASLIKAGLHELEILKNNLEHLGLKCGLAIVPTMVFGSHLYTGLLFQVVCNLRRRKNKMTVDVIAAGGRYDALLESLRSALALESDSTAALASKEYNQCGVGISISFDKLVAGYDGEDCAEWNRVGTRAVDVVICSVGHPLAKEKLELMRELWSHGIRCHVLECSQTLEAAEEQCKEMGAVCMIILKENEYYSSLRVKIWEKEMFHERKMSRQEAVELISRKVYGHVSNELLSSSNSVGISRSESLSMKLSSTIGNDSSSTTQVTNNAAYNISIVVQEKEKLANWKKRYENQVMHHITDVLPKLAKQQYIEVLGLDVNNSVINTLAACLVSSDKDEFYKGVSDVIEKHPRLRKYLQNVCDEIYELWFEKSASVIILYGLLDNSYRVLL